MTIFNDDLAFVHVLKTGGISARKYLADALPGALDTAFTDEDSPLPVSHIPVRDLAHWTGRPLDSWEKIVAVIRDPFDRQVSLWYHWRDTGARGGKTIYESRAALWPEVTHWLTDPFCRWALHYELRYRYDRWGGDADRAHAWIESMGIYEWWFTVDGEIPDNLEIIRFENLTYEFADAVDPYVVGRAILAHENQSVRRNYPAYYTHLGVQFIHKLFDWTFDEGYYERADWGPNPRAEASRRVREGEFAAV